MFYTHIRTKMDDATDEKQTAVHVLSLLCFHCYKYIASTCATQKMFPFNFMVHLEGLLIWQKFDLFPFNVTENKRNLYKI